MALAQINTARLNAAVKNAVDGLVQRAIKEETEKACAIIEARIAVECKDIAVSILTNHRDYDFNPNVNVIISIPSK